LWLPTGGRRPEWRRLLESDEPPADLARLVLLNRLSGRTLPQTPAKASPEVALELRRTRTRRRLNRAARVLYRVRSRASEFGPLLLRFLDLAEAGVEELTYFSNVAGEGPNAVIEHYLLANAALGDDDLWPELDRFDCPRTLEDHGLPLFLPAELDFCPQVEGLLRGGDGDDSFLLQLRERVGLPEAGAADGVLALILPESSGAHWQVMHLAGGQPLRDVITLVNRQAHREPVRRALDVTRLDLAAEHTRYEGHWQKLGLAEAEEAVAAAEAQIRELGEATEALADELKRYDARLEASRAVTEPAAELLSHGLPGSLGEFADRTAQLLAELAHPQRAWLADTDARQAQLRQVQADVRVLQENAAERVARVRSEVETNSESLAERQQRLQVGAAELAGAGRNLETAIQEADAIATATESELQRRADALRATLERLQEQERALAARDEELGREENRVRSLEQHLEAERIRLEAKQTELQGRRRRAEAETRRLQHLEMVELPALAEQLRTREAELSSLQQRGIERRHAQAVADLAAKDRELEQARLTAADLERQLEQLKLRTSEHQELTGRIRSLRLQLERMPPAPTPETVAATRHAAQAAELALASARSAREHLDRALVATQTAFADEEFEAAELALRTLGTAIDTALRAAESARPAARLTSLEDGLRDLSARVAALRNRQPSFLGRVFQRFRS
jgi:chromosome segregation ATPase